MFLKLYVLGACAVCCHIEQNRDLEGWTIALGYWSFWGGGFVYDVGTFGCLDV